MAINYQEGRENAKFSLSESAQNVRGNRNSLVKLRHTVCIRLKT